MGIDTYAFIPIDMIYIRPSLLGPSFSLAILSGSVSSHLTRSTLPSPARPPRHPPATLALTSTLYQPPVVAQA
jgi:hypothetical protein